MSKTSVKTTVEWHQVNWRKLERRVFKLQKRIYRAAKRGEMKAVRRLQKTLLQSWDAKLIAVRKVTQDDQGHNIAGVDGVKSLSPEARIHLASQLKLGQKAKSTRRVWIAKPRTDGKKPLGILTLKERALQVLAKMALEPEWEARFEPNSYGCRPGRSCQDAIEAIFVSIHCKPKYVLNAEITKCFDRINQEALLTKINTFPSMRRQIKSWLKAGVMAGKLLFSESVSMPQTGVIYPLLTNIALHGLEEQIKQFAETLPTRRNVGKKHNRQALNLIRYANSLVILHEDISVVQQCQAIIADWLKDMGLEVEPSYTKIAHTLNAHGQEKPGFNFLGFKIRQYPAGVHSSGKSTNGDKLGFKTIITPNDEAKKQHYQQLAQVIDAHKAASQGALIEALNSVVREWANYYAKVSSTETFKGLDHLLYRKLVSWAKYRHPHQSWEWISRKYWKSIGGQNWVFATKQEGSNFMRLLEHCDFKIETHTKVKGDSSPYDGNLGYWSTKMGKNPEIPRRVTNLIKRQKGKCAHCGFFFRDSDVLEIDQIIPTSQGGKNTYANRQLLHRHCHNNS